MPSPSVHVIDLPKRSTVTLDDAYSASLMGRCHECIDRVRDTLTHKRYTIHLTAEQVKFQVQCAIRYARAAGLLNSK